MALNLFPSTICSFTKTPHTTRISRFPLGSLRNGCFLSPIQCSTPAYNISSQKIARRSANYQPPIWNFDYVQSLRSEFLGEAHTKRISKLKEEVREMFAFDQVLKNPLDQLELIETLQRLGLDYHFQEEIKRTLTSICSHNPELMKQDLYATALQFKLLRQHGFHVPQDVFNNFKDKQGKFKLGLSEDLKGMLSLYEASYLCEEGESSLEDARKYSIKYLKKYVQEKEDVHCYLSIIISHALEVPLHWRVPRVESRWFIDVYQRKEDMNPLLLELAKLDFNYVQAVHQEDLKYVSWWWKNSDLAEKLSFARNKLMQSFLWTVGIQFEAEYGYGRRMITKVICLVAVIDDIYDVYGTLDELELFTSAVEKWDVNSIDQLPDYMKITFPAIYNSINEMGFDVLKKQGFNIIPYLKKSLADLCECYLLEAKWYCSGYKPTLQQYIDMAWVSITGPLLLLHYYFFSASPITTEALDCFHQYPDIIRYSSLILRLTDDLGTSSYELKRGDNPKSIQCYMNETGASEEEAREHIRNLIREAWTKINMDRVVNHPFSQTFIGITINLARTGQFFYQHGDGYAIEDIAKDEILSLFVNHIPL